MISLILFPNKSQEKDQLHIIESDTHVRAKNIFAARNDGRDRPNVNVVPHILEVPSVPIIDVRAVILSGDVWPSTQEGPRLTIYAHREGVSAQSNDDHIEHIKRGTSLGK